MKSYQTLRIFLILRFLMISYSRKNLLWLTIIYQCGIKKKIRVKKKQVWRKIEPGMN